MSALDFDVIVVGLGPSGATFANLMGRRGWRVGVFEQAATVYDKPRAITADQEVMRVFQECGLAEQIEPTTSPHPGTDFVGLEGQVIKRFYPAPPPHRLAWEPTWMFVQPELEATLRHGLSRYPSVVVHLEHEYLGHQQDTQGVSVRFKRINDNAEVVFRANYLVGSDGGRSAVRRAIGARIEDLAFDEWWIVVDAWLRGPTELPPRCVQYCRPSRPGTFIVGPDSLRRWEIKMLPGETPDDFQSEESVMRVLRTFVDTSNLELCRTAIYRFHALVVDGWRDGRVFLMGDAAHQTPPFLGQGLCAGIRDAVNLAWKLDGVRRHAYPPALLDSYEAERKPHVRTVVAHAKSFGLIIGELDEAAARRRDKELGALLASGRAETVRQKFIPNLETGFIAQGPDGLKGRGAGELFVQPWVITEQGERRLDDLLPTGFLMVADTPEALGWLQGAEAQTWQRLGGQGVLVLRSPQAVALQVVAQASDRGGVPPSSLIFYERDGLLGESLAALGARVLLVRPDRYVFGAAADAAELAALVPQLAQGLQLEEPAALA